MYNNEESSIVSLFGLVKAETAAAVLLNDGQYEVWLPKSQIAYYGDIGEECIVEMPEWLALKAGLI